jgi:hypothetical protein
METVEPMDRHHRSVLAPVAPNTALEIRRSVKSVSMKNMSESAHGPTCLPPDIVRASINMNPVHVAMETRYRHDTLNSLAPFSQDIPMATKSPRLRP